MYYSKKIQQLCQDVRELEYRHRTTSFPVLVTDVSVDTLKALDIYQVKVEMPEFDSKTHKVKYDVNDLVETFTEETATVTLGLDEIPPEGVTITVSTVTSEDGEGTFDIRTYEKVIRNYEYSLTPEVIELSEKEITSLQRRETRIGLSLRETRNKKLAETDWVVTKAYEEGTVVPEQWKAYRKALRDLPTQEAFPYGVVFPTL